MTEPDQQEVTTDAELSEALHQLFMVEGKDDVEIISESGPIILTRSKYLDILEALKETRAMTQEDLEKLGEKIQAKANKKLRKALVSAEIRTVDIEDEDNFGLDIEGNALDIEGKRFILAKNYPAGVFYPTYSAEVGAFVDASDNHKDNPPIRVQNRAALSDAMEAVAEGCTDADRRAILDNLAAPEKMN